MGGAKNQTARYLAAQILSRFDPRKQRVASLLDKRLSQTEEPQRCTDLVFGVLRHRTAIDHIITELGGRQRRSIQKTMLAVLRVAVYELVLCPNTPEHALVNEAVETAKQIGGRKPAGFVNALLRRIQKQVDQRLIERAIADPQSIIVHDATMGCLLKELLWPNPQKDIVQYLAACYSLPDWLVVDWIKNHGYEVTQTICLGSNRRPRVFLRANTRQLTAEQLQETFQQSDIACHLTESGMLCLEHGGGLTKLPGYAEGSFTAQDPTAAKVAPFLDPQPGERILDLCAAPGGKTTHIAELAQDKATIIATDIDAKRLQQVQENIQRLKLQSIQLVPYTEIPERQYDAVLLDVPCSNTGVLAKRIEVRYRLRPNELGDLLKTQADLLDRATTLVNPTGRIIYSTCSIQPEENEQQVTTFLKRHPDWKCTSQHLTLPSPPPHDCDGGFVAVLVRD